MSAKKRLTYLLIGPIIFIVLSFAFSNILGEKEAQAIALLIWMIFWWVSRPVELPITGLLPIIVNALLNIVPMKPITSSYVADSIVLVFGAGLLIIPWANNGLDKRVALKALSIVGPSMKSQVTVWLLASIFLSTMLPNVMVTALFCPIAVAMLNAAGYDDIPNCKPAVSILLAIGWGVSLGGAGTPLGGAMNLVAIEGMQKLTGQEVLYIDWIIRVAPYLIVATIVLLVCMLLMPMEVKHLEGTKSFFKESYTALGPIKHDEIISLILFLTASIGSILRPLYADLIPALTPAYLFLTMGSLSFFIFAANKNFVLTWKETAQKSLWGMFVLFAGGLAIGAMLNESGASEAIADVSRSFNLDGGLLTIIVFAVATRIIGEMTTGTTAAAVSIPIVITLTTSLGLNPIPYWFITIFAYNEEFMFPLSVRSIPVAYGLDPKHMLKGGIVMTIVNLIVVIAMGYFMMKFWPTFSTLTGVSL